MDIRINRVVDKSFKNLIPCDDWATPFVDAFAQFSLGFHQRNLGPAYLHPRSAMATYEIAMPLLQMWLKEGDSLHAVRKNAHSSYPWLQEESARFQIGTAPVHFALETIFTDSRQAWMRFRMQNQSAEESITLAPIWYGCLRDKDQPSTCMNAYPDARQGARELGFECSETSIRAELRPNPEVSDLPHVAYRIRSTSGDLVATPLDGPCWGGQCGHDRARFYQFEAKEPVTIPPQGERCFDFVIDYQGCASGDTLSEWPQSVPDNWQTSKADAGNRYIQNLGGAEAGHLDSLNAIHELRAKTAILRNGIRGHNGEFGDKIASLCSAGTQDFSCSFFWDTLFTSVALSTYNAACARDAISTAFTRQNPRDGAAPERKWNYSCKARNRVACPQSAIGAWALSYYLKYNQSETDLGFAREIYPQLKQNHLFWRDYSDSDRDGLSEYNWSGQIGDNSQMWDAVSTSKEHSGCFWLPPIASATCNSFLFRDAVELSRIAEQLDLPEEAVFWKERSQHLQENMKRWLWVDSEQRYLDYNHRTQSHNHVETFFTFLPLWAGLEMPQAAKKKLIEQHLLNPDQFFGSVPFPSAPYDHPEYESAGYWRGRAWSHFSSWLIEMLWTEGYCAEADEAANRIIAWQEMWDFRENMNTDPTELFPEGFVQYNWGSAAYLFLSQRLYRTPK
jgi:hypothetical protein